MNWKPRIVIAGVIVVAAFVLTSFHFNTFITGVGWLAAGYLFGTAQQAQK